jgi:L-lactate dehydrogenase complex protein LldE
MMSPVRASLFITCLADTLFPQTGRATVAVLERVGVEVDFPLEQTCCGQMHANTGYGHEVLGLVRRFVRVFELSELLVRRLGVEDVGASFHHRVTYHPTCHSLRLLKVGDAPLALLRAVRGIDLVELPEAQQCCGFGGTFAVKNSDTSTAMLTDKLRRILDTRADVCTAADSSCLMHIGGGLQRSKAGVRVMHLAEILASEDG